MELMTGGVCARRWPYFLFVLVSAFLFFAFVFIFPTAATAKAFSLPFLAVLFGLIIYAGVWSEILTARLAVVGLPHSRWIIGLYALLIYIACFLLSYLVSEGRFLAPWLFLLLNMPLVVLREKPRGE